ncbi:MAG: hypothetical protein R2695_17915 [Acidimicrobiales bacterium]
MAEPGAATITPRPTAGRVFEAGRRVRLGDVDPSGRCRLDAVVRHLQDVARDDSADSELNDPMNWIVRRTLLQVHVPRGSRSGSTSPRGAAATAAGGRNGARSCGGARRSGGRVHDLGLRRRDHRPTRAPPGRLLRDLGRDRR